MTFQDWLATVPDTLRGDPLWKTQVYPLAVFVGDIGWPDVTRLMQDGRTVNLAGQLYEALGSISANLAEGYSPSSHKDQARFYEYALGSARESRDWYYKARHILGDTITDHRLGLLTQIIRYLLVMIPDTRGRRLSEDAAPYHLDTITVPGFDSHTT